MQRALKSMVEGILCSRIIREDVKLAWDLLVSQNGEAPTRFAMMVVDGDVLLGKPGQPGLLSGVTLQATLEQLESIMEGNHELLMGCILNQPDLNKVEAAVEFADCFCMR